MEPAYPGASVQFLGAVILILACDKEHKNELSQRHSFQASAFLSITGILTFSEREASFRGTKHVKRLYTGL